MSTTHVVPPAPANETSEFVSGQQQSPSPNANTAEVELVPCCVCKSHEFHPIGRGIDFEYETCDNEWTCVACEKCGHHFLNPRPTPAELGRIYPDSYGNYSNSVKPGLAFRVKAFLESFTLKKLCRHIPGGGRVLDIGCGDGRLLDGIRNATKRPLVLEGVEISKTACQAAIDKGYEVHVGSFDTLTLKEEQYDLICLIQVIEHVFEPITCLTKIERLLKPGGIAIIETPNVKCVDFSLFRKRYWGGYHFPRHLNLFEPATLSKAIESTGLTVERLGFKLQPVHWVWSAHHWFKERGFPRFWTESFHIRNPLWLGFATIADACQRLVIGRTSNMQIIARK